MMKTLSLILLFVSGLVLFPKVGNSTHLAGGEIYYTNQGDPFSYRVTVRIYADCTGNLGLVPDPIPINVTSASTGVSFTVNIPLMDSNTVQLLCPTANTSNCAGGTTMDFNVYTYFGSVLLPNTATDWLFSYCTTARNPVTNVVGSPSFYIDAMLDNVNAPGNSSPQWTEPQGIFFIPMNQPFNAVHFVDDLDDDDITFVQYDPITCNTGTGASVGNVTYNGGLSFTTPFTAAPLNIDPVSGMMTMSPGPLLESSVSAVYAEDWRNGQLVGYSSRDFQMIVGAYGNLDNPLENINNSPTITGFNGSGVYEMTVTEGDAFGAFMTTADSDPTQFMTVDIDPGNTNGWMVINSTGTQFPTITINGMAPQVDECVETFVFFLSINDGNCDYNGLASYAYVIHVLNDDLAMSLENIETPCPITGEGFIDITVNTCDPDASIVWTGPGIVNQIDEDIEIDQEGTYTVTVTDENGIQVVESYTVNPPELSVDLVSTSTPCSSDGTLGLIDIEVNSCDPNPTITWSPLNGGTVLSNGDFETPDPDEYTVTVTDVFGNTIQEVFTVEAPPITITLEDIVTPCDNGGQGHIDISISSCDPNPVVSWSGGTPVNEDLDVTEPGEYTVTVTDLYGSVEIDVYVVESSDCPYDFDNNGVINVGDLLGFLGVFGTTCNDPCCFGDFDYSGNIATSDLLLFLPKFGLTCAEIGFTQDIEYASAILDIDDFNSNALYSWDIAGQTAAHNNASSSYTHSFSADGDYEAVLSRNIAGDIKTATDIISISGTSNSCDVTSDFTYAINANNQIRFYDNHASLMSGTVSYEWHLVSNDGNVQSASTKNTQFNLIPGKKYEACFTVKIDNGHGGFCIDQYCQRIKTKKSKKTEETTLVHFEEVENAFASPNPSDGQFMIQLPTSMNLELGKVEIRDISGKLVFQSGDLESHQINIDLTNADAGVYLARVYGHKEAISLKLIVR